jgi:Flp pilus assembly pilin Flp
MKAQAPNPSYRPRPSPQPESWACARNLRRLFGDETAATTLEYVLAALAVALGAVAGSRAVAGSLANYLRRIYTVVTLPIP